MIYFTLDGDDVGRLITSCYLRNDANELLNLSGSLQESTHRVSELLKKQGFTIIFCAADGIAAYVDQEIDLQEIYSELKSYAPAGITFSAGAGASLREAYIALISAKSSGKNCLHLYGDLN